MSETLTTKKRDSNLELFRIITMIMIVAHHYVVNSGLKNEILQSSISLKNIYLLLFGAWGKIGINCFVFITGYFMCKSNITARKFVKLLWEILFYKVVIGMIFIFFGYGKLSISHVLSLFIPVKMCLTALQVPIWSSFCLFLFSMCCWKILMKENILSL